MATELANVTAKKPYFVSPSWKLGLHDLGADPASVLRRARLPADLFARTRAALSAEEFFRLWVGLEQEVGDPMLPVRLGESLTVEAFDPLIFAALCSDDLNTAMPRISTYKRTCGDLAVGIDQTAEATSVTIKWFDATPPPPDSLVWSKLVYFTQIPRMATRHKIVPLSVRCPTLPAELDGYTEYFGVTMTRGDAIELRFSAADATRPFLTANDEMWQFFEEKLKRRLVDLNESSTTTERVESALLELLPSGAASLDAVAKKLGVSARTLKRRLKEEVNSYQRILDETRERLAKHYLKSTALSGAEISFLLGFKDPNSFFRAFNSWTGTTPERARRELSRVH